MKKLLLLLTLFLVIFIGCKKNDEKESPYAKEQEGVLKMLNGQFYCNELTSPKRYKTLIFKEAFKEPKKYKFTVQGTVTEIDIHGLVNYYYWDDSDDAYICAYHVSSDGAYFTYYTVKGDNLGLANKYKIVVHNNDKFDLYDMETMNPMADKFSREK